MDLEALLEKFAKKVAEDVRKSLEKERCVAAQILQDKEVGLIEELKEGAEDIMLIQENKEDWQSLSLEKEIKKTEATRNDESVKVDSIVLMSGTSNLDEENDSQHKSKMKIHEDITTGCKYDVDFDLSNQLGEILMSDEEIPTKQGKKLFEKENDIQEFVGHNSKILKKVELKNIDEESKVIRAEENDVINEFPASKRKDDPLKKKYPTVQMMDSPEKGFGEWEHYDFINKAFVLGKQGEKLQVIGEESMRYDRKDKTIKWLGKIKPSRLGRRRNRKIKKAEEGKTKKRRRKRKEYTRKIR